LAASSGSALESLLITQEQADFMAEVKVVLESLDSETLAEIWCQLNAWGWPIHVIRYPLTGSNFAKWARQYFMQEIARVVPKSRRLAAWNRRSAQNNQAQRPAE
jgi:hypothetical protein